MLLNQHNGMTRLKIAIHFTVLKMFGATIQNLVIPVARDPGFMHPRFSLCVLKSFSHVCVCVCVKEREREFYTCICGT